MTDETPIRIAVVGSGPAGFYAAGHLLKDSAANVEVDMIERLPTPWGLVRSGVAPDHPKIKSVSRVYEKTAAHPRFRFFGNLHLGDHVSRDDLCGHYHAIVKATNTEPISVLPMSKVWYDVELNVASVNAARIPGSRATAARSLPTAAAPASRYYNVNGKRAAPRAAAGASSRILVVQTPGAGITRHLVGMGTMQSRQDGVAQ